MNTRTYVFDVAVGPFLTDDSLPPLDILNQFTASTVQTEALQ